MRPERATAGLLLALLAGSGDCAMYKWVDENGRVQYSDKPPAEQGKKGAVQMTNRGVVIKKIDPAITPEQKKAREEELARKKEEETRAAEQRKKDKALLQSFTSVEEIDMKRDREMQSIEVTIANLRVQERSAAEQLAEDRRRLEGFAKRKKPPPEAMHEDIKQGEAQVKLIRDEIERRHGEVLATRATYEALKKRYRELREQDQAEVPASTAPSAAQAPARK